MARADFTIKSGSYCPVCRGITLCDCGHTMSELREKVNGMGDPDPRLAASLRATVRHLDMVKVCINDPECRAVTERKIEEARAVLRAAGVDPDGGA